ncbi:MAG TPA: transporter substrate-binding domain-containing protein [Chloroflexi bacterium]|nr:transporter substrate-binding domain-containing protein [Chloroflexota bacterium]
MSNYRKISLLFSVLIVMTLLLAACGGGATPAPVEPATEAPKVEEPAKAPATEASKVEEAAEKDLLDEVTEAGKLLVSTDPNYAPQSFLNDAGELDGFDVNVAKEVAKRLGVEVEFVTPEWDMITGGNWSSRWDVSIGSMTPTEPRAEVLRFTDAYYYVPASFAVHKDNTDIAAPADLAGKKVGLGTATTYEDYMNGDLAIMGGEIMYDSPSGIEMSPYPTDGDAIQDLALGDGVRLDAVMSAQPTIQTAIDSGVPLKYVGTPAFYEPLAFALDKSRGPSDKMLAKLNEILAEMHSDGTLAELSLEWYGLDYTTLLAPGEAAAPAECAVENLALYEAGKLTVATGEPVYPPWMMDDDPGNGEGFESAVVYALASELGFAAEDVQWVRTTFDEAISPVEKLYDFNLQQYSITEKREEVVDFSLPYYRVQRALVALDGSPAASARTFDDLADVRFGAMVGTTDLEYIEQVIGASDVAVYNAEVDIVSAMAADQVDATVIGLPTAFFITAVQLDNGVIAGVLPDDDGGEGFGLLFTEGSELVPCVNNAIQTLTDNGTLDALVEQWLQGGGDIPNITK